MADYSERATQLPEARPVSNITPANSALVESAGQMVDLFTEYEKTGKKEAFAEGTRNSYFQFLGSATDEIRDIAKADQLAADAALGKPISPEDQSWIKNHQDAMNQNKAAYEQGFKRLRDFRLDEERRLRTAIQARPDLGDELRAISQKELGMDVYTAKMKMFNEDLQAAQAAAESAAGAADKRKSQAMAEVRFKVETVGGVMANIYRNVDVNAPPESPNSIESARAMEAGVLSQNPEIKTEESLGVLRTQVSTVGQEFNAYLNQNGLNDPARMQQILADTTQRNQVMTEMDKRANSLRQIIAGAQSMGTGAYKADSDAIVKLAEQQLAQIESLKNDFTPEGVARFVEFSKNDQTVKLMNANPVIVNIAGDMIPKGAPDADRAKAVVTADTLLKRVSDNSWSSATEYTTTIANSVPQVGNILLSDTIRSPALLPAKAPALAFQITAVAKGLSTPYKNADGTKIAPPMESIVNRQGTGFLNLVTQASDNAVKLYNELNPEQKKAYAGGIIGVTNMYIQQKYQQAKLNVPPDVGKYVGVYKITDNNSLDRSDGSYLGWLPNTPAEVKAKYQPVLDKVQYSETGPNGLSVVRNTIKMMTNPSETSWFGGKTGK
jgi:hypothetical protein